MGASFLQWIRLGWRRTLLATIEWSVSSFLQCSSVNVEALELSADDCCLSSIINLLKIIGEARAHGPDVPSCQSQRWRLCFLFSSFVWCGIYSTLFGVVLSSKHPLKQADCDGSAPYWLGAAQFEAGDS